MTRQLKKSPAGSRSCGAGGGSGEGAVKSEAAAPSAASAAEREDEGSAGSDDEDLVRLPLQAFWACLDEKQRASLLTISRESLVDSMRCNGCRELLESAVKAIEVDAGVRREGDDDEGDAALYPSSLPVPNSKKKVSGSSAVGQGAGQPRRARALLRRMEDGTFVSEVLERGREVSLDEEEFSDFPLPPASNAEDFAMYSAAVPPGAGIASKDPPVATGGQFLVQENASLRRTIGETPSCFSGTGFTSSPQNPTGENFVCTYCADKFNLRFVDMLTYPRPVRKFRLLLDKHLKVHTMREMMSREMGMESMSSLVLLWRGRPITRDKDMLTLAELGVKSNQMVAISRQLGVQVEDDGTDEKNKQFVGDLLFGNATTADEAARNSTDESVVATTRVNHGCQILGRTLDMLAKARMVRAWQAEVKARASEAELLASIEAEEGDAGGKASSKKNRNKKKKEKERKKREDAARKAKEEDEAKRQSQLEKQRKAQERQEAEKKAKVEQARIQREAEELRWREEQAKRRKEDEKLMAQQAKEEEETRRIREAKDAAAAQQRKEAATVAAGVPPVLAPAPKKQPEVLKKGAGKAAPQQQQQQQQQVKHVPPSRAQPPVQKQQQPPQQHRPGRSAQATAAPAGRPVAGSANSAAPKTQFCTNCGGAVLVSSAKFCAFCGSKIAQTAVGAPPQPAIGRGSGAAPAPRATSTVRSHQPSGTSAWKIPAAVTGPPPSNSSADSNLMSSFGSLSLLSGEATPPALLIPATLVSSLSVTCPRSLQIDCPANAPSLSRSEFVGCLCPYTATSCHSCWS
jgi:hypothetical protein